MKTKLLKQIRKKYQIVYNPDDDSYLVRDKKCHIKKYKSKGEEKSLRWTYDVLGNFELFDNKKWHFYSMIAELGYMNIVDEHVIKISLKKEEKRKTNKQKQLFIEFSKCYHNKL